MQRILFREMLTSSACFRHISLQIRMFIFSWFSSSKARSSCDDIELILLNFYVKSVSMMRLQLTRILTGYFRQRLQQRMNQIFINAEQENEPIYSPRNIIKLLSRVSEDEVKQNRISKFKAQEIKEQFDAYLKSIQKSYIKYIKNRTRETCTSAQQEMQAEVKLSQIPVGYFNENWKLGAEELSRRSRARQKHQQLEEFLDQIQLIIFTKTSKYPDKTFLYIKNIIDAEQQILQAQGKIQQFRIILQQKIQVVVRKSKRIQKQLKKRQMINQILTITKSLKKVRQIELALKSNEVNIVQQLSSKQIDHLKNLKIGSVQKMVSDFHECEEMLREKYLKALKSQLSILVNKAMYYRKEEWVNNNIPDSALNFNHNSIKLRKDSNHLNSEQKMNASVMNISILDQSYFEVENQCVEVNYQGVLEVWEQLWKMGINGEQQLEIVELLMRDLVRNNVIFNRDFQEYIHYVFKIKGLEINNQNHKKTKHQDLIEVLDAKFYLKIVRVYYNCLRNVLEVIRKCSSKITFLKQAQQKVLEFIKHRIQFFLSLRPLTQQTPIQEVAQLCNIIDFWVFEEELEEELAQMRVKMLEQYTLMIHKNIQVNCLKRAIQASDFKPISIPSEYFMSFDSILSWQDRQETEALPPNHILQESISIMPDHSSHFRIIDKKIIIQGQQYRICDSFLQLIIHIQKYLQIKSAFMLEMQKNIDQKICQIVGFYCWYNKKNLMSSSGDKSIRNLCLFVSMSRLLIKIVQILNMSIAPKRLNKLNNDVNQNMKEISSEIQKVPLQLIEAQVSRIYESRIKTRKEIPSIESKRIIQVLQQAYEGISFYFSEKYLKTFLQPSVKMITKNYFGFLINLDTRGKAELKWFLPKFKQVIGHLFPNEIRSNQLLFR